MENRFEKFTQYILSLNRSIQRIKSVEMAKLGLKGVHANCMHYLKRSGGLTQAEMVRLCGEDKAYISRAVSALLKAGLVCEQAAEKKRNAKICLTEQGESVAARVDEMVGAAVAAGGEGFTEEDRERFYAYLGRVNDNLDGYLTEK